MCGLESVYNLNGGYGKYFFESGVPAILWAVVLVSLIVVVFFLIFFKKPTCFVIRRLLQAVFIGYFFILYCSTVICRPDGSHIGFNLEPFWSYRTHSPNWELFILGNLLNVIVFIPFGILSGRVFISPSWKLAILIGSALSVIIELSQFIFRKGFAELDDVIHNTLGCLIGFGVYLLL